MYSLSCPKMFQCTFFICFYFSKTKHEIQTHISCMYKAKRGACVSCYKNWKFNLHVSIPDIPSGLRKRLWVDKATKAGASHPAMTECESCCTLCDNRDLMELLWLPEKQRATEMFMKSWTDISSNFLNILLEHYVMTILCVSKQSWSLLSILQTIWIIW